MNASDVIAVVAIGASLVTTLATLWWTDRRSRDSELRALRKESATVMGPVLILLVDVNPDRWALLGSPESTMKRHTDLIAKWEAVRPRVAGIAASDPDSKIRDAAQKLEVALHCTVTSTAWLATPNPPGGMSETLDRANTDYATATTAADRLAALLRGEP